MNRRELREQIFKMLFRVEFYEQEEMPEQLRLFIESIETLDEDNQLYIEEKYNSISAKLGEIDEQINKAAKGWKTSRMGKVDLTLIRLAVYEMQYDDEVPVGVAINEAVELSKKFGGDDSSSFVNGILAKMV